MIISPLSKPATSSTMPTNKTLRFLIAICKAIRSSLMITGVCCTKEIFTINNWSKYKEEDLYERELAQAH